MEGEESSQIWFGTERKLWEDHAELFHYTNKEGLDGILKSQTLFATHYAYLNDQEEITRFRGALKSILIPKLKLTIEKWLREGKANAEAIKSEGGILRLCNIEIDTLIEILYRGLLDDGKHEGVATPYIFSFCSHAQDKQKSKDGLLSQWRGYAKEGGFAIVFDTEKLETLLKREADTRTYSPLGWGDVIYQGDEEKLQKELGEQIKIIEDFLLALAHARAFRTQLPEATTRQFMAHAACTALYKHNGFKEENEVRIYAYRPCDRVVKKAKKSGVAIDKPQATVHKFNNGKPYIELFKNFGVTLPIKRIIVGPQKKKEQEAHELKSDPRLKNVGVSVSGIPYVEQSWGQKDEINNAIKTSS